MNCIQTASRRRSRVYAPILIVMLGVSGPHRAWAQATSTPAPALAPYALPILRLVQPGVGALLPQDKPVGVFRFASAESLDPIDALSFSVVVDGTDRTMLFHLSDGQAWGSFAPEGEQLSAGQHKVAAKICTARGACGSVSAAITVVTAASESISAKSMKKRSKLVEALIQAARTLLLR